jgi:DNA transformation protein and related proteins
MPKSDRFVDFAVERFSPLGEIAARAMMGGWCLYCDGIIFALAAGGALFLKGDEINIPKFNACGLLPFKPFPDQDTVMKYFQAPPEIYEDAAAMREWVGGAVEAGRRAQAKKKKPSATRKKSAGRRS